MKKCFFFWFVHKDLTMLIGTINMYEFRLVFNIW